MKITTDLHSLEWWYWFVTLMAIITGLTGVIEGLVMVVFISTIQCIHFSIKDGLTAFRTQVRLVYGLVALLALFDPTYIVFWLLLVGTVMVTFFNRCIIARVLLHMPWNKNEKLS